MEYYGAVADSPEWRAAWGASANTSVGQRPYYRQAGAAGPQEAFAEAFAIYHKWGPSILTESFGQAATDEMQKWSEIWAILDEVP